MIQIFYSGTGISLNKFYSSHWTIKQKMKEDILNSIDIIKKADIKEAYKVDVLFNSKNDCDNCISLVKVILDHLRKKQYLIDDNTKYFKKLSIEYDESLAKNFYQIVVSDI